MVPGSAGEDSGTSERLGGETPVSLLLCFRGGKFKSLQVSKQRTFSAVGLCFLPYNKLFLSFSQVVRGRGSG